MAKKMALTANVEPGIGIPDVSVVMPAFNAAGFIRQSVLGVMRQTFSSLELIVVDDASTDETGEIIRDLSVKDSRIRLFRNPSNSGVSFSRNLGIRKARGRFLMFHDADDLWDPEKVGVQIAFMRERKCPVSYMDYCRFRDSSPENCRTVIAPDRIAYEDLLASNEIGMLTAAIDLHNVSMLPAFENKGHEDYLFWLELLRSVIPHPALRAPSDKPLAWYRERAGSVSSNRLRSALWHWNVLALQKQPLSTRIVLMARYIRSALGKRGEIGKYSSGVN